MSRAAGGERMGRRRQVWADAMLAVVTLIWGSTFVLVKDMVDQATPLLFLAVRFTVAGLALALVTLPGGRWRGLTRRELLWGAYAGAALWAGYAFQTLGLQLTSASNAGFITGLSVVLVPVLGWLALKQRPGAWTWVGIMGATVGLALMSLKLESGISVNLGDLLVLGCAFSFAAHILLLSRAAAWADALRLTAVQMIVAALLNSISAASFEKPVSGLPASVWIGAVFLGIVATALAFSVQTSVQRFTSASHTALIFTLEPVFAALFGFWLQGDRLTWSGWLGALLILAAMLVAEVVPLVRNRGEVHSEVAAEPV